MPSVGLWESLGCYKYDFNLSVHLMSLIADVHAWSSDTAAARTLNVPTQTDGSVSIETCTDACFNAGYPLAGTEFADECYCGLDFSNGGAPTPLTDCSMVCAGNSSEFCGGPNRLNVGLCRDIAMLLSHCGVSV